MVHGEGEEGMKSIPKTDMGYTYRIPRYDGKNHHVTQELREEWVKEAIGRKKRFSIHYIVDKLYSLEIIKMITDNPEVEEWCGGFEIITGPSVCSDNIRDDLGSILAAHPKICVSKIEVHPRDAGFKLDDNMLLEEEHSEGEPYRVAFVIERASRAVQSEFMSNFYNLRSGADVIKDISEGDARPGKRKFSLGET